MSNDAKDKKTSILKSHQSLTQPEGE